MKHWRAVAFCVVVITGCLAVNPVLAQAPTDPDEVAEMRALDAFLAGFDSKDPKVFASALHFPHVQLEGGNVRYFATEQEYVALAAGLWSSVQPEWDHPVWDDRRVVQR